jgi:hypothetical protein
MGEELVAVQDQKSTLTRRAQTRVPGTVAIDIAWNGFTYVNRESVVAPKQPPEIDVRKAFWRFVFWRIQRLRADHGCGGYATM